MKNVKLWVVKQHGTPFWSTIRATQGESVDDFLDDPCNYPTTYDHQWKPWSYLEAQGYTCEPIAASDWDKREG